MAVETRHDLLVAADDFAAARHRVERFFELSLLLNYDRLTVMEHESLRADRPEFRQRLEDAMARNSRVLEDLVRELEAEGFHRLDDLRTMGRGYHSKLLHTATHLLDGFIGIDSAFYCLEEDSHWPSDRLRRRLAAAPEKYWLVRVRGGLSDGEDPFQGLRSPETEK